MIIYTEFENQLTRLKHDLDIALSSGIQLGTRNSQCCHWEGTCPWTGRDGTRPGHVQEV